MTDVSIVIPVAPYHADIAQHAILSAQAQTVPCVVIPVYDDESRGAGWARNQGLAQVNTSFVIFLDADDTIDRAFAARCMSVWQPNRYIYSDWMEGTERKNAPACPFVDGSWHVVTTLIPTAYARRVGGFDETLDGAEDTHFYLKLMSAGYCGLRLALPLFNYGDAGQRAKAFVGTQKHTDVLQGFSREFGGTPKMTCCGNNVDIDVPTVGDQQPGDVEAMSLWLGNRQERGKATGRLYPRTGNGKRVWVDPRDVAARPDLWRVTEDEDYPDALEVIGGVFGDGRRVSAEVLPKSTRTRPQADFARVIEAGKQAFSEQ